MHKLALIAGIVGMLALLPSGASAGGKPTRAPVGNSPFEFPAGMVCSFGVAGEPLADNEVTKTFPQFANGDVVQTITGHLTLRLTNAESGKSIVLNVSGPGSITTHPDGSVTTVSRGQMLGFLFPTDVPAGPASYLYTGRVVANFTPDGQETVISHTGTRQDMCDVLSS
jgi:hypothetical protein